MNYPSEYQTKILNHMGISGKTMSKTHEEMQCRQITLTDLFHLLFPNLGDKGKCAVLDSINDIVKTNWQKINAMFDKHTYLIMHCWKETFKYDIWPSDYSTECMTLFDFTALAKQGVICHRSLSVILKALPAILGPRSEWNENMKSLNTILSLHMFGCRLFKVETSKEMQHLIKHYAKIIVDKSCVIFYTVFFFQFYIFGVCCLWFLISVTKCIINNSNKCIYIVQHVLPYQYNKDWTFRAIQCVLTECFNIIGAFFNNAMQAEILHQPVKQGFKHVNWKEFFEEQVLKRRQAHSSLESLLQSLMDDGKNYYIADKTLRLYDSKLGRSYIDRHDNNLVNILLRKAKQLNKPLIGIKYQSIFIPRKYFNQTANDALSVKNRSWIEIFARDIAAKHPDNLSYNQIFDTLITVFSNNNYFGAHRIYTDVICNVYKMLNIFFYRTNYMKFTLRAGDSVLYKDSNNQLCVATVEQFYLLENKDNWIHENLFKNFDSNFKRHYNACLPEDLFFWNNDTRIDWYPVIIARKWNFVNPIQQTEISRGILSLEPHLQPLIKKQNELFILPCACIQEPVVLVCNHNIEKQIFNDYNLNSFWEWNTKDCKWCMQCVKHKLEQVWCFFFK